MKRLIRTILLGASVIWPSLASPSSLDRLIDEWTAKQYDAVLPELLVYRKGVQGRTWKVDYMIGTSLCHGSAHSKAGIQYLANVFQYKDTPPTAQSDAHQEINFCTTSGAAAPSEQPEFRLVPISGQYAGTAGVYGKGGYNVMSPRVRVTTSVPKAIPITLVELESRIFQPDQADRALQSAKNRLGDRAVGVTANGFVVVCAGWCEQETAARVAACLHRYQGPLKEEFDILPPEPLVTVYLPADINEVAGYARKIHGVDLPLGVLAYSVVPDLSIVGIGVDNGCGSLAHELLHLSIKGNFGDSPAWLEEGLASEVAVSAPQPGGFQFAPNWNNWRVTMLRSQWSLRPSVSALLSKTWTDFATTDPAQLNQVAATHAMAAVFVQYLDAQKKLKPTYVALRDRRSSDDGQEWPSSADIVRAQFGKDLATIDGDFSAWFQAGSSPHGSEMEQH